MAVDGSQLCQRHLASERKRIRKAKQRTEGQRRKNGMCAQCGRRKAKTFWCAVCSTRFRADVLFERLRLSSRNVTTAVTTPRVVPPDREGRRHYGDAPLADGVTLDAEGRRRYRGQEKGGAPSIETLRERDLQSIRWAIAELEKMIRGLQVARSDMFDDRPRSERKLAEVEALSHGPYAQRFVQEVLDRCGYVSDPKD